jgi:hypothetical protein
MEKRKYEDLDVTEHYELSMLMNTYKRMQNESDAFLYNVFYECFCIHALNLANVIGEGIPEKIMSIRLLGDDLTEEEKDQAAMLDVGAKIINQVMTYPRKEPTYEEKVKNEDCGTIYKWIMKHYDVSLIDQVEAPDAPST